MKHSMVEQEQQTFILQENIKHFKAQGRSNAEIAQSLVLSMKTVRNYISSTFSKLQVADRSQAIIRAREAGLG